jgi:glutamyl-tRNA reductase
MVLGEGQILSQVKDAVQWAREHDLAHEILQRAFLEAVSCGKRVRTDTKVGEGAVSVAYAGVTLAKRIFSDLSEETALLIGAGETGRRAARHLQLFGVSDIRVCNRSWDRGAEVAEELDAVHVPWDQLDNQLPEASILVTATAAPDMLIGETRVREALRRSGRRQLFCMDLSVPRDIEESIGRLPGVFLYNVDDLQGIVLEGEDRRRAEAAKAQRIVEMQVEQFVDWFRARSAVPLLAELRRHVDELRRAELDRARNGLDEKAFATLDRVTERLAKKWLHDPTVGLKRLASGDRSGQVLEDFRELFGLDRHQADGEDPRE